MAHFKDLIAWQKSMELVMEVYSLTRQFPREELYGLTTQLRRAAVSIPSNVAEGQARYSKKDFRHFPRQSRGSLAEVETQLTIASRLGYVGNGELRSLEKRIDELGRILSGLISSIPDE